MITAEQWMEEIDPREFAATNNGYVSIQELRCVQLDAWKQGMTDAAAIHANRPPSEHYECQKEILAARDEKETL